MYHYRLSNKVGRCRPPSVEILSSTAPVRILCVLRTASSVKPTLAPLSAPSSHCPWELHPHPLLVSAICVRHRSLPNLPAPAQTCSLSPGCPSQKPSAHLASIPGALPTERYSMLQPVCARRLLPDPLSSVKDISSWFPPLPPPTSCPRQGHLRPWPVCMPTLHSSVGEMSAKVSLTTSSAQTLQGLTNFSRSRSNFCAYTVGFTAQGTPFLHTGIDISYGNVRVAVPRVCYPPPRGRTGNQVLHLQWPTGMTIWKCLVGAQIERKAIGGGDWWQAGSAGAPRDTNPGPLS